MMVELDNKRIKAFRANAEKIRARGGDWQLVADTLELINAKGSM